MSALSHCSRWFPMPSLRECDDVRCSLRLSIPGFPLLSIGSRVMPAAGRQGDSKLSQRRGLEKAHLCRVASGIDRISEESKECPGHESWNESFRGAARGGHNKLALQRPVEALWRGAPGQPRGWVRALRPPSPC